MTVYDLHWMNDNRLNQVKDVMVDVFAYEAGSIRSESEICFFWVMKSENAICGYIEFFACDFWENQGIQ